MPGQFGPMVDKTKAEAAVISCLQDWLHTTLGDVESNRGIPQRSIVRPRTWQADVDVRKLPERTVPAVVCVCSEAEILKDGQFLHATWTGAAGVVLRAKDSQAARDVAGYYGMAILAALVWKLETYDPIGGFNPTGLSFSQTDGDPNVHGAVAQVNFTVLTPALLDTYDGPHTPDPLPDPGDPDPMPTYPDDWTVADIPRNPEVTADPTPFPDPFED